MKQARHPKWGGPDSRTEPAEECVSAGFDVFLTVDRNLPKQQNLADYPVAVIVLRCTTNDISDLRKLVPELLQYLPAFKKGQAGYVGGA